MGENAPPLLCPISHEKALNTMISFLSILFVLVGLIGSQHPDEPSPATQSATQSGKQSRKQQEASKKSTERAVDEPSTRPATRPTTHPAKGVRAPAVQGSPEALSLAQKAKAYAGGEQGWAKVQNIVFTFFGGRRVLWDRKSGRVRIEPYGKVTRVDPEGSKSQVMYYETKKDRGWIGGKQTKTTTTIARATWVNDTYWLLFALKLLDPGTKLRVMGLDEGWMGEKKPDPGMIRLHMSFENVGETPKNEYVVWIQEKTGKIHRWDYYQTSMKKPISWFFEDYKKVGPLFLSLKRSQVHGKGTLLLQDVAINVQIPESTWKSEDLVLDRIGRKSSR